MAIYCGNQVPDPVGSVGSVGSKIYLKEKINETVSTRCGCSFYGQ